ncbi:zinc-binding metallopeptidase family protein [Cyclobacterium amurskyense]|uniref:zinc-binding metallopeptidase family protein n=1 Tax=Cyclobacterium amurskyense TaxID=320787 RepID=UPI0030D832D3
MKLFQCGHCRQLTFFENTHCSHCQSSLGFDPISLDLLALKESNGYFVTRNEAKVAFRFCENNKLDACNWLIPQASTEKYCKACSLNRVIPDLVNPAYRKRWIKIEQAKHRLVYALLRWKLPFFPWDESSGKGLGFEFKASQNQKKVLTGHASGIITMNIAEADDVERAMARKQMDEVYRTVLGHFRHEIGHYYWEVLIAETEWLEKFRSVFGDESISYSDALDKHYSNGAPDNWQENFISSYASAHPWEDWAESWAHYLHMVDTLETAYAFGLTINPKLTGIPDIVSTQFSEDAYGFVDFSQLLNQWTSLSLALNSLNRSMGLPDPYPFVISSPVSKKLAFIHELIHSLDLDTQQNA